MNRQHFLDSTKRVVIYLKEYNFKLCRKGLLERGLEMKISFGEFKTIEQEFLKRSLQNEGNISTEELFKEKEKSMQKEIKILENALVGLSHTINSVKSDVKSRINKENYGVWLRRITKISDRFKGLYSEINNDQYNHGYKMSKKYGNAWNNILHEVQWTKTNVCNLYANLGNMSEVTKNVEGFQEGDLSTLFFEKSKTVLPTKRSDDERRPDFKKETFPRCSLKNPKSGTVLPTKISDDEKRSSVKKRSSGESLNDDVPKKQKLSCDKDDKNPDKDHDGKNSSQNPNCKNSNEDSSDKNNHGDLENVSDDEFSVDDEMLLINNLILVDEIGEVNLSNFEDMIERMK